MFKPPQLEVESWKGDWGLPSIDYKCLEVLVQNCLFSLFFSNSTMLFDECIKNN